jgi:organic radical activating enzyme
MKEIIKIDSNLPNDLLRIELVLSDYCNYECWYCFPGSNAATQPWPKLKNIVDNITHILDYYKEHLGKKQFVLHVTGGEPTLWKDFGEFAKHFHEYGCVISMSSNGSRTLRWWKEYGHYFDHVILSCHHEAVDVAHTNAVADILYDKKVWVNAIVLMDPRAWDKCVGIVSQLKQSKRRWSITAVEVFHSTVHYTKEQFEYISKSCKRLPNPIYYFFYKKTIYKKATVFFNDGTKKTVGHNWLLLNKLHAFNGWDCNIGIDTFVINKRGELSGACGENLYNLDYKFNIFDADFKEKYQPVLQSTICHKALCPCTPETNARKEKLIGARKVIPLVPISSGEYRLHRYTTL